MQIVNLEKNNVLKYLIAAAVALAAFVLLREIFFKPQEPFVLELKPVFSQIDFKFNVLENKELEGLAPFAETAVPENMGRENPFAPY